MNEPMILGMVITILVLMIMMMVIVNISTISMLKKISIEREKIDEANERKRRIEVKKFIKGDDNKNKKEEEAPAEIRVSGEGTTNRIHTNKIKANTMLVPENLSEEEKALVRDFYNL